MATVGTDVAVMKGPQGDVTGILTDQEVARCSESRILGKSRQRRPLFLLGSLCLFYLKLSIKLENLISEM